MHRFQNQIVRWCCKPVLVAVLFISGLLHPATASCQAALAPTPPMGFMTWNFYAENITEAAVKSVADAMVTSGLRDAGYQYIFIDDGWQGGRDKRNNIIPDADKFPSGMKALCDYVHAKQLKLGIYSDAAPLTCAGYTGSLNFEEQDAATFASWGIDYLKYDYCGAPADAATAKQRYAAMARALQKTNRPIVLSVCEWGDRQPWLWASNAGGQLWRTTPDIRDKWKSAITPEKPSDLHRLGAGIADVMNINATLAPYAGAGHWNDADMLNVGLYGKKGPSGDLGGTGCTDTEYQSQMSLWCLMAAPLMVSCDVQHMNDATKRILLNKEVIAIDQDPLGIQASRVVNNSTWQVFVKPLAGGAVALGILNLSDSAQQINQSLAAVGIPPLKMIKDLWTGKTSKSRPIIRETVLPHETKLYILSNE